MKKITFILFTLITGSAFAQNSTSATAPVNATIVAPIGISLVPGDVLDFGTFTTPETGTGTVTLLADGTDRNFSSTDMEIAAFPNFAVPTFNVTNSETTTYKIILASSQDPKSGSETLTLSDLTTNLTSLTNNNASSFSIGGKITVPSTQIAGDYIGEVKVTVAYE